MGDMSKFLTDLEVRALDDKIWVLTKPLVYLSDSVGYVEVPKGFHTDLSSVPRVPFIYTLWGGRAHYEGVAHDFLYRADCPVVVTYTQANYVFYEAATVRGKPAHIKWPMYAGVILGGWTAWKKRSVYWDYAC